MVCFGGFKVMFGTNGENEFAKPLIFTYRVVRIQKIDTFIQSTATT